jgi:hypothetical protein
VTVHRVRRAKAPCDGAGDHIFVEVEKNRWLEVESLDGLGHESIQAFLECEVRTGLRVVGFTDQNFQWGTVKDWTDSGMIRNLKKRR